MLTEKRKAGRPLIGDKPRTPSQRMADARQRRHRAMIEAIGCEPDATDNALVDLLGWALKQAEPLLTIRRVLAELNKRYPQEE